MCSITTSVSELIDQHHHEIAIAIYNIITSLIRMAISFFSISATPPQPLPYWLCKLSPKVVHITASFSLLLYKYSYVIAIATYNIISISLLLFKHGHAIVIAICSPTMYIPLFLYKHDHKLLSLYTTSSQLSPHCFISMTIKLLSQSATSPHLSPCCFISNAMHSLSLSATPTPPYYRLYLQNHHLQYFLWWIGTTFREPSLSATSSPSSSDWFISMHLALPSLSASTPYSFVLH